jgi:hypothetical protein
LDQLNAKETSANLRALLDDHTKVEASGEQLKDIFLECILSKARKSLEHLKRYVEIYSDIFYPFYKD